MSDPAPGTGDGPPGERLLELVAVMDRLRSAGGCPWDAAQTHASLVEYLIEETYETVDAIDAGDRTELREELGDLLLQVVFHARIAAEDDADPWDMDDVAGGIVDKLIARHPHVFAGERADSAADVEAQWQARKTAEKGRTSVTDGVPRAMPALMLAAKLLGRAERGGVSVPVAGDRQARAVAQLDSAGLLAEEAEYGALLLALVAAGRERGHDPDAALRAAVGTYRRDVRRAEGHPDL